MKKFLFALIPGCVSVLVAINGANAQNPGNPDIQGPQKNVIEIEKVITPVKDHLIDLEPISPKALKDFAKKYKNVTAENWMKNKHGFSASFFSNGIQNMIYYDNNGKWLGSLKGYREEKLPYEIRDIVKSKYYDYSINSVEEAETIDSDGIPTYIIQLEDKNIIKLMRVYNGQVDVMRDYKK